jgi:hypothetical protein
VFILFYLPPHPQYFGNGFATLKKPKKKMKKEIEKALPLLSVVFLDE